MSNKKKNFDFLISTILKKKELQKIGDEQKNVKQKKKKSPTHFFLFWRQKINSMKDDSTKSNEN